MKIADIEFPTPLLNALRDGKLVIFAGAGVSRGKPACLPNFESLANKIAKGTGKSLEDAEPDDFLGKLQDDGVKIHARAAEELSGEYLKATELHWNLLRLYPDAGPVRIVTTNFDLLFEQAAGILKVKPEVFRAPALPLGDQFNGICPCPRCSQPSRRDGNYGQRFWSCLYKRRMGTTFSRQIVSVISPFSS